MGDSGEVINYRNRFRIFLLKEGFSEYGADIFLELLSSTVDFYIQILANPNHKTIFEINDVELLTEYYSTLMRDPVFVIKNRSKEKRPGSALLKYIEFAKKLNSIHQSNKLGVLINEEFSSNKGVTNPDNAVIIAKQINQNLRFAFIRKVQSIIQPIDDYLIEYQLSSLITFEYISTFKDVDVREPCFNSDLDTEAKELEELMSLMTKYEIPVPNSIRRRQEHSKEQMELRASIRCFENWIVGYMNYLKSETLEVESVFYSPQAGYTVNLTGQDIAPTRIRMKTKGAKKIVGIINSRGNL